jgi:hypothetical protein
MLNISIKRKTVLKELKSIISSQNAALLVSCRPHPANFGCRRAAASL